MDNRTLPTDLRNRQVTGNQEAPSGVQAQVAEEA
jgi:hypothetical protein